MNHDRRSGEDRRQGQSHDLSIALQAVQLYAETHPRPYHVTQKQAAEMLQLSEPTIGKLVRSGALRLDKTGRIPITEIDNALRVTLWAPSAK